MERVTGIEPALSAWEAEVLPLNYTRERGHMDRDVSQYTYSRSIVHTPLGVASDHRVLVGTRRVEEKGC